jgi:hypothetical protein
MATKDTKAQNITFSVLLSIKTDFNFEYKRDLRNGCIYKEGIGHTNRNTYHIPVTNIYKQC